MNNLFKSFTEWLWDKTHPEKDKGQTIDLQLMRSGIVGRVGVTENPSQYI